MDLPACTVSCETSEQLSYSSTSVLVKFTYPGDIQEKEKEKVRRRAEKAEQGREREGKQTQRKIKYLQV